MTVGDFSVLKISKGLQIHFVPYSRKLCFEIELSNEKVITVQILGHTDSDEKCPGDNLILSQRRAEAVRAQLLARGVEAERLISTGMGHTDPIADNLSKAGKAANRRIEFLLITEGQEGIPPPQPETIDAC